jgi:hypothetical protein
VVTVRRSGGVTRLYRRAASVGFIAFEWRRRLWPKSAFRGRRTKRQQATVLHNRLPLCQSAASLIDERCSTDCGAGLILFLRVGRTCADHGKMIALGALCTGDRVRASCTVIERACNDAEIKTCRFPERYDRKGDVATYTRSRAVAAATGKAAPRCLLFSCPEASERRRLRCPPEVY